MSVSPLPIISPPSGRGETLKGPLPKWPPSLSVSSSSAHFGPSGISVPLQSASSDLTRRSCNCLPPASTTTQQKKKLFESDKVVNFSPSWKTQNFCECWKARCLLSVELLTVKSSFFSCNFQTLLLLCSPSHCFIRLFKEKQLCRHLPSPSSCPSVFHWYSVPSHRSSSPFMLPSTLTTSDSVFVFCLGCFEKSLIFYLFYSYMSLFWFIPHPPPPSSFYLFFSIMGVAFKDSPQCLMYISDSD